MADSTINIFGSSGEAMVGADTINTILASMDSKLTSDDINIETLGDGTVDVDVKNDTYTINLNHEHEGMAKLVVDTAANLPDASEMENDTIYGELDDGEIATIYLGGYPFYGGGGGASSGPVLRRPAYGATIDMGQTTSGTVSKTINVKGKSLTQALTIQLSGTGYSFGTTQPSGVTRDSSTQLTVTAAAANVLNGVDIVVVYTGSADNATGELGISSGTPDNVSSEVTLVANQDVIEDLAGVKFNGNQYIGTDYKPGPHTEFEMKVRFEDNSNSLSQVQSRQYILCCPSNTDSNTEGFALWTGTNAGTPTSTNQETCQLWMTNGTGIQYPSGDYILLDYRHGASDIAKFKTDESIILYSVGTSNCTISYYPGGNTSDGKSHAMGLKSYRMQSPMSICRKTLVSGPESDGFNAFDLTIYEFKIWDWNASQEKTLVHHWVPKSKNGVAGLYDLVTNEFIHSDSGTELIGIPLTTNN